MLYIDYMAWVKSSTRTTLLARAEIKQAQLDAINAAILAGSTEVDSYTLDTGEGSQRMKYRSIADMMDAASRLENDLDKISRRLAGRGLINFNLRRRR